MTVYFHGNFGLDRSRMAGILSSALSDPSASDAALAKPFGYGAPFASRYRSWLHKSGITELGKPTRLTELGTVLHRHDAGLESDVAQAFIHWQLTTDPERAEAWHFFANEFLPRYETFTADELLMGVMEKLRSHSEEHFGPGSRLNEVIVRKLIDCYVQDSALGGLGLIAKDGGGFRRERLAPMLGPWDSGADLERSLKG